MKKMKRTILLVKLVILCGLAFGVFYTPAVTTHAQSMCNTCNRNCDTAYNQCINSGLICWIDGNENAPAASLCVSLCKEELNRCKSNCQMIVCCDNKTGLLLDSWMIWEFFDY